MILIDVSIAISKVLNDRYPIRANNNNATTKLQNQTFHYTRRISSGV